MDLAQLRLPVRPSALTKSLLPKQGGADWALGAPSGSGKGEDRVSHTAQTQSPGAHSLQEPKAGPTRPPENQYFSARDDLAPQKTPGDSRDIRDCHEVVLPPSGQGQECCSTPREAQHSPRGQE